MWAKRRAEQKRLKMVRRRSFGGCRVRVAVEDSGLGVLVLGILG